jgi:hypothetical protein
VLVGEAEVAAEDVARRLVVAVVQKWRQSAETSSLTLWNVGMYIIVGDRECKRCKVFHFLGFSKHKAA